MNTLNFFQTSLADRRSHRGKEKSKGKGRRYFFKASIKYKTRIIRPMFLSMHIDFSYIFFL